MKVIIWVYENDLEKLIKGEEVEYFDREPGIFEKVIQISVRHRHLPKTKR